MQAGINRRNESDYNSWDLPHVKTVDGHIYEIQWVDEDLTYIHGHDVFSDGYVGGLGSTKMSALTSQSLERVYYCRQQGHYVTGSAYEYDKAVCNNCVPIYDKIGLSPRIKATVVQEKVLQYKCPNCHEETEISD